MSIRSLTYQQGVFKCYHGDKHFSEFLRRRWRQKSTGIGLDMGQNYVTVTLCTAMTLLSCLRSFCRRRHYVVGLSVRLCVRAGAETFSDRPSTSTIRYDTHTRARQFYLTAFFRTLYDTIRYDMRYYFNVRSKADMSELYLPHGTDS